MKRWMVTAACAMAALAVGTGAYAHGGGKPQHGGVVQVASEIAFELAQSPEGATLYLEDHGKPMATQGATGKLTVLKGSEKSEAELVPAGDNKLVAKNLKLDSGAKAVAAVTLPSKKVVTVRFTVK